MSSKPDEIRESESEHEVPGHRPMGPSLDGSGPIDAAAARCPWKTTFEAMGSILGRSEGESEIISSSLKGRAGGDQPPHRLPFYADKVVWVVNDDHLPSSDEYTRITAIRRAIHLFQSAADAGLMLAFTYYPFLRGIVMAFQNYQLFDLTNVHFIGLDNFKTIFTTRSSTCLGLTASIGCSSR